MKRVLSALTFITLLLITWPAWVNAQEIRIDNDDLGGVVTSSNGPEAGVWVIAETTD